MCLHIFTLYVVLCIRLFGENGTKLAKLFFDHVRVLNLPQRSRAPIERRATPVGSKQLVQRDSRGTVPAGQTADRNRVGSHVECGKKLLHVQSSAMMCDLY